MARLASLAVALARPTPLALAPSLVVRALAGAAALVTLVVLAYVAARETPLFAVSEIEVAGAPPAVARDVRSLADGAQGASLLGIDGEELEGRIAALPSVRSAEHDRAFPSTLRILVRPERPLAVVRLARSAWLVSEDGTVIRAVERGTLRRLPRIWTRTERSVSPGTTLAVHEVRLALRALAAVPARFPRRAVAARAEDDALALVVAGGSEIRLGAPDALRLKLAIAKRVLETVPVRDGAALAYVDVSLPERPVVGENSKPETSG